MITCFLKNKYTPVAISKMLLATNSKEEQSQRIMMEQVDKEKLCEASNFILLSNPPKYKCIHCGQIWQCGDKTPICNKQDKPVEKKIKYGDSCPECGLSWAHGSVKCNYNYPSEPKDYGLTSKINSTKDTNKTSLEVPKKIEYNSDRFGHDIVIDRINELIDYLTLISLKERK